MKRDPALQPLSRQHHNGLLIALLLHKGIRKNAPVEQLRAFIIHNWNEDLKEHFEQEENILLPALVNKAFDQTATERLLAEHEALRAFVDQAKQSAIHLTGIEQFASLLEHHIRFEERVFFPAAERALSPEELARLGALIHEDESRNCMNYPFKFWQ